MDITVKASKFTVKARQLNESLYELHLPQGLPTVQVLFFHGFQRDYEHPHLFTWTAGDESGLWPQTWLVERFPDAHILAVSYFGGKLREIFKDFGKGVDVDMFVLVENLISDILHAKIGQEPRCPVILVGHSFGGLVAKQVCVKAFNQLGAAGATDDPKTVQVQYFVDNLKGVFFYATPHYGIQERSMKFVDPVLLMPTGPLLEYMKILGKETARLNDDFDRLWRQRKDWRIAGLGENLPTKLGRFEGLIVPEGSSRYSADFNIAAGMDHISIARPGNKTTRSFTALENLLASTESDPELFGRPGNWQFLPESITGIEHALVDVKLKLKRSNKLGLVGMGGVGKTTLAKALFNDLERGYQYTCFIADVKNLPGSQDTKIRDAILERLYYGGKQSTEKDSGFEFLKGKRLLLVLDDVNSERDLQIVSSLLRVVHKSTLFIATSRDPIPLNLASHEVHDVQCLGPESSRKLFLSYAFPNGIPNDKFQNFLDDVVGKCGNLPLTLEVLGKHLCGKEEAIWIEALRVLDKPTGGVRLGTELWAILKLSYDGLESREKDMFLDACTVFYKEELNIAMTAWSITTHKVHATTWQRLVALSLVWEVKEGGRVKISMHDQLLSLGTWIASTPPENGRRIWNDDEKALRLLSEEDEDMDDLKDIIALKCCWTGLQGLSGSSAQGTTSAPGNVVSVSGRKLQKMRKLQYLWLQGIGIDQTHRSKVASVRSLLFRENVQLPSTIVYLHFDRVNFSGFTFSRDNHYNMAILKIVECSRLHKLPDALALPQGLEHIELQDTSLESVPDFEKLRSLKSLRLSWVATAKFPSLPECLKEDIRKWNFPGPFTLKVENGKLMRDYKGTQVNRSLYELYRPEGETKPTVQVVFFHGIPGEHDTDYKYAHLSAWKSGVGTVLWPQTWLAEEFPNAQTFSVSYYSLIRNHELYDPSLLDDLLADILHANIGQEAGCPVVLVGHSLGALVVKQLCVNAVKNPKTVRLQNFVDNLKGMLFYTPHFSSWEKHRDILTSKPNEPVFQMLRGSIGDSASTLNYSFARLCGQRTDWKISALSGGLPAELGMLYDSFIFRTIEVPKFGFGYMIDSSSLSPHFTALVRLLNNIAHDPQFFAGIPEAHLRYPESGRRYHVFMHG